MGLPPSTCPTKWVSKGPPTAPALVESKDCSGNRKGARRYGHCVLYWDVHTHTPGCGGTGRGVHPYSLRACNSKQRNSSLVREAVPAWVQAREAGPEWRAGSLQVGTRRGGSGVWSHISQASSSVSETLRDSFTVWVPSSWSSRRVSFRGRVPVTGNPLS